MRVTGFLLSAVLTIYACALPGAVSAQVQQPGIVPRDRVPAATGTASISGRVTDAQTGIPLRRTVMQLSGGGMREPRITVTDADGRYTFTQLPAGSFSLYSNKTGYVSLAHGQSHPAEPTRQLQVSNGQTVTDVNFALPRGGVITGRVVDEFGEPVVDAMVAPLRLTYTNGRRRPGTAGRTVSTNDLGEFRIFGVPPGDVLISASTRMNTPFAVVPDGGGGYATTYYPGTPVVSQAQRISVAAGQVIADLTIMLTPTKTFRISGTAFDARGVPLRNTFLSVSAREAGPMSVAGAQIQQDGTFLVSNVPPGEYQLSANVGPIQPNTPPEMSIARVIVSEGDVTNVRLDVPRPVTVSGRLTVEGGAPLPRAPLRLTATPREPSPGPFRPGDPVAADQTFTFLANPSPSSIVRVQGLPPGWLVRSMRLDGRDVIDGIEIGADIRDLEIELTNRVPDVTVNITNTQGAPAPQTFVVLFPQDADTRARGTQGHLAMTRADDSGVAHVRTVLPGNYYAVALSHLDYSNQYTDPEVLETLIPYADRVVLTAGDVKTITLAIKSVR